MIQVRRRWWIGAIVLAVLFLLILLIAPEGRNLGGSTYGRYPDGYGAWFAYMQKRGTPGERWQRPFAELNTPAQKQHASTQSTTLLQIYGGNATHRSLSEVQNLAPEKKDWVQQGNTLILLGTSASVTPANFSSKIEHLRGLVQIDTTRRLLVNTVQQESLDQSLLRDRFGAVAIHRVFGKGNVILVVTPYLGANAYQDAPGNFAFLADLVTQHGDRWLVDEYLHGFKDRDIMTKETGGSWLLYLAKTPWVVLLVQGLVVLGLFIWSENRRFGQPLRVNPPAIDNSKAYIQALASVLQKAESSEFVVETIGKEEQLLLQRKLGLGSILLEPDALVSAWTEQTGRSPTELQQILHQHDRPRQLSDNELEVWLKQVQKVRDAT